MIRGMECTLNLDELRLAFSRNVKSRRKELGLTQIEVANRAGMPQSSIAQFEAGKRLPSMETLVKLAEALQIRQPGLLIQADIFSHTA